MSALAIPGFQEVDTSTLDSMPACWLRQVRTALSRRLEAWLAGTAPGSAPGLPPDWLASMSRALECASPGGRMHQRLAEVVALARSVDQASPGPQANAAQIQENMRLIMLLADLEVDTATLQGWLDPLTGLPGRCALQQRLESELSRVRRGGQSCVLVLIDLDGFKSVNDEHGHLVGDEYLRVFASVLRSSLRGHDGAYRYGGDEFILCLPDTSEQGATLALERIQHALQAAPLVSMDDGDLFGRFSAGLRLLDPRQSLARSLEEVDRRMYEAKRAKLRAMVPSAEALAAHPDYLGLRHASRRNGKA